MKRIAATIAAALIAASASAQTPSGETLRVLPSPAKSWKQGDTLRRYDAPYRLFDHLPCDMDMPDAHLYRLAKVGDRMACWAPLLNGGYVIQYWNGQAEYREWLESLPRAGLNTDGSVTITEAGYDSKTWMRIMSERYQDRARAARAAGRY